MSFKNDKDATRYMSAVGRVNRSVLSKLGHRNSVRGRQRALALFLGHQNDGRIDADTLKTLCDALGCYNRANFTQNMKKDGVRNAERALWTDHTYRGSVWSENAGRHVSGIDGSWRLTDKGRELAAEFSAATEAAIDIVAKSIAKSINIKSKAQSCPYCRDVIEDDDRGDCNAIGCSSQAHMTCVEEFIRSEKRCVLSKTTIRCQGHYAPAVSIDVKEEE